MVVGWVFGLTEWWLAGYLVVSSCRDVGFLVVFFLWFYRFCLLVVQHRENQTSLSELVLLLIFFLVSFLNAYANWLVSSS